jgi:diaminobutyrate-2-oxoglutarate transaminase
MSRQNKSVPFSFPVDVLVLSKAIGGGLPLSVVVYHVALDKWQPGAHAGTFRGNQLAMAVGSATIRYIQEQKLWEHSDAMGGRLMSALSDLMTEARTVGDVRGRGLMIGVEIVDQDKIEENGFNPPCFPEMARRIQQKALDRGLILELGGRLGSVVRFLPPLIVTPTQIDDIATIFIDAVHAAEARP